MSQRVELRPEAPLESATTQLSGQKRNQAATGTQQFDLKALAAKGLKSNQQRNQSATDPNNGTTGGATEASAKRAELMRLVPLVTSRLNYFKTEQDHTEALENALKHPDLALPFWRGKAKQLGLK